MVKAFALFAPTICSLAYSGMGRQFSIVYQCLHGFFFISPCIVCGSLFDFRVGVLDMGLDCDVKETERSHRVQIRLEHEVNFAMCTEPSRVPGFMNAARLLFFFSSGP